PSRRAHEAGVDLNGPDVAGPAVVASGRHRPGSVADRPGPPSRARDGGPPAHLNVIAFTAERIFLTITSAISSPCSPWKPFMAATMPTISRETRRIRPTYSTVPWPRSPAGDTASRRAWRREARLRTCAPFGR